MDESGAEYLHNPNLGMTMDGGNSDSSDEDYEGMVAPGGYSLLPSEPGNYAEDSCDSDAGADEESGSNLDTQNDSHASEGAAAAINSDIIPDTVLASEAEAASPTIQDSDDLNNPAAREKYPYGKIPSYLHVPSLQREKEGHLWNEKRSAVKKSTLDKGHESAILKAMSGFHLPPESIPSWAKNIPEDQWRKQLGSHTDSPAPGDQSLSETVQTPDSHWVAEFPEDE
ncbi:hypothetical protein EGW08_018997 [Elysia chlorotica]|uniref:Male-enhanced antigen 1 n=1 Tax=Elysia chlorotica TaxID=188477 RepID=A0A433SVN8_ELYCH|nr:hypothetical protein EGW08_018997 [Elysia chlorotica]